MRGLLTQWLFWKTSLSWRPAGTWDSPPPFSSEEGPAHPWLRLYARMVTLEQETLWCTATQSRLHERTSWPTTKKQPVLNPKNIQWLLNGKLMSTKSEHECANFSLLYFNTFLHAQCSSMITAVTTDWKLGSFFNIISFLKPPRLTH